jgi:hypothetical protein
MILLVKDTGAPIRQVLAYLNTIIVAAVVDDQQLEVGKTLHQHRLHCLGNETFSIINGHNDTDRRLSSLGHIYAFFGLNGSQISNKFLIDFSRLAASSLLGIGCENQFGGSLPLPRERIHIRRLLIRELLPPINPASFLSPSTTN